MGFFFFFFFFFFLWLLGFELKAYTFSHSAGPIFVMGFFEIGSRELFAQGWLQTVIQLPEKLGLQA
jgi:hypothetical protein